jgi:uncharacterized membrane protein
MLAYAADWLNLLLRWAHLVAGISWIGTSFYFMALDASLQKREKMNPGVFGTAWEVHGGGFYHVEKYTTAPADLPPGLIWFKWEAYLTWMTGFALLVVQYYVGAGIYLIDPSVMALSSFDAIAISLASLFAGWVIYDLLCKSPLGNRPAYMGLAVLALVTAAAWGFTHVFSGRGALIHVGAFIGTIMAANVFAVIIPNQRKITASLMKGEAPDPALGKIGKLRSTHNSYLTLPVLILMVSNHYPMLTNHPQAWILISLIVVGGAAARHFLLRIEVGDEFRKIAWTLPIIAATLITALILTVPKQADTTTGPQVSDAEALAITNKHCTMCHAKKPTHEGFAEAPKGVWLETPEELRRYASLIKQQAVDSNVMPIGNETGMTDDERAILGRWIAAQ